MSWEGIQQHWAKQMADPAWPFDGHCHVNFKAGRMHRKEGKLSADRRKGQLAIVQEDDDYVTLKWHERETIDPANGGIKLSLEAEVDQLIFPSEAIFDWVSKERRVIRVSFNDEPDRNLIFWLQEPSSEWDELLLKRCTEAINGHPNCAPAAAINTDCLNSSTSLGVSVKTNRLPTAANDEDAANVSSSAAPIDGIEQDGLNTLVQNMLHRYIAATGPQVGLNDIFSANIVREKLAIPGMMEALMQYLPAEHQDREQLLFLSNSPQFHQQMASFSHALQTSRIDVSQFGIDRMDGVGVLGFLEAIQKTFGSENAPDVTDIQSNTDIMDES